MEYVKFLFHSTSHHYIFKHTVTVTLFYELVY